MQNGPDTERYRRLASLVTAWGGWATCSGLGVWSTLEYDPNHGDFAPQWVGLTFIFAMGVAIAGSLARSRMRLTRAILSAFKAGQESQNEATDRRVSALMRRLDAAQHKQGEG